jgi:hypothetical protein
MRRTLAGNGRASIIVDHIIADCAEVTLRCARSLVEGFAERARQIGDLARRPRGKLGHRVPRRELRHLAVRRELRHLAPLRPVEVPGHPGRIAKSPQSYA